VLNAKRYRSITPSTAAISRASGDGGGGGAGAGAGVGTGDAAGSRAGEDRINGARSIGGRLVVIVAADDDVASVTGGGVCTSAARAGGVAGGSGGTNPRGDEDAVARAGGGAVARPSDFCSRSRDALSRGGAAVFSSARADALAPSAAGTLAAADEGVAACDVNTIGGAGGWVTFGPARSESLGADCVTTAEACSGSRCIHAATPSKATEMIASARAQARAIDGCVRIQVTGENGRNSVCGGGATCACGTSTHILASGGVGDSCGNSDSQSCAVGRMPFGSGPPGRFASCWNLSGPSVDSRNR